MNSFNLEKYMSEGVDRIVSSIAKASIHNPKATLLMMHHGSYSKKARAIRVEAEKKGNHIPPFLISSITNKCNLHCSGCYARAEGSFCADACFCVGGGKECCNCNMTDAVMTVNQWDNVFCQAEELGIEFVLLAGGEPFMREDVLKNAGSHKNILFPVFTNGTLLAEKEINLLEKNRNLLPVISLEGNEEATDERRGFGVYKTIECVMQRLKDLGILFGISVTVTKKNIKEVYSEPFVEELEGKGAKAIIYVEYVPVDETNKDLAPDDDDRAEISRKLLHLRDSGSDMLIISFPGDEKSSGGCLAAGRGFFHINPFGGAEPCPFSPFSDTNVKNVSLLDTLKSPLFVYLQTNGNLTEEHVGGCTLFEQRERIEKQITC